MALRKRKKAKTKLTFAITIPQPENRSIRETRADIVRLLEQDYPAEEIKVYLLNKETTYA